MSISFLANQDKERLFGSPQGGKRGMRKPERSRFGRIQSDRVADVYWDIKGAQDSTSIVMSPTKP